MYDHKGVIVSLEHLFNLYQNDLSKNIATTKGIKYECVPDITVDHCHHIQQSEGKLQMALHH